MNRLDFIKKLALTSVAAIVAPKVLLSDTTSKNPPLKFTAGNHKIQPEAGAIEYNGKQIYLREPKLMVVYGKLGCGKTHGPHNFNKFKNS